MLNKEKIRTLKGFILSLLLHLSILLLFWVSTEKIFFPPPAKAQKKITLDLSKFVPPAPPPQPRVTPAPPPQPVIPPQPKKVVQEKPEPKKKVLEEKKILVAKKDTEDNNITKKMEKPQKKIVKKEEKKPKEKKVVQKKETIEKKVAQKIPPSKPAKRVTQSKPRPKQYASPLANSLMGSNRSKSVHSAPRQASNSSAQRMVKQLYGSEFDGFSAEQKKFINENLGIIHQITQMTLIRNGYPEIAARTGQQGVNIVSFYLHPNGNITGLRLDQPMGYEALDENTLQVIRIAYKDYPLPLKTTKIKFFVQYSIGGY